MNYLDGVLVVEGTNDASFVSSFIKCEIVILNGYDLKDIDYLKEVSKIKQIFLLTDPDEAGRKISQRVRDEIPSSIDICVDISKCFHKNKQGIAECKKDEILSKLSKFIKSSGELQQKLIEITDICFIQDKEQIKRDFHLGECNTKKMVERLNSLQIKPEKLNGYK